MKVSIVLALAAAVNAMTLQESIKASIKQKQMIMDPQVSPTAPVVPQATPEASVCVNCGCQKRHKKGCQCAKCAKKRNDRSHRKGK